MNVQKSMKVVQAYTHDLLIFSNERTNLTILTNVLKDYMNFAHIYFHHEKYRIIVHNAENEEESRLILPNYKKEMKADKIYNVNDISKNLGVR